MIAIGVDIGGTTSRVAAVDCARIIRESPQNRDREGAVAPNPQAPTHFSIAPRDYAKSSVISLRSISTPRDANGQTLIDWLVESIREIQAELSVGTAPIGLALPGPVDRDRGVLLRSVNLPFLENRPIERELRERTCQRVTLWTDAEAATWGEYAALEPAPRSFVHLRFGTGVACGIIVDDQFAIPKRTNGGHLDVLVVDQSADTPLCPCGKRGCLEAIVSGLALMADGQSLASLQKSYDSNDQLAVIKVQSAAKAIQESITNLTRECSPSVIVLGGGVIENLPALLDELHRARRPTQSSPTPNATEILHAQLGDAAGAIGAAMLAARVADSD